MEGKDPTLMAPIMMIVLSIAEHPAAHLPTQVV
jgi:hypothetical protein